jgi:tetratricopeptide (TPR) repeat protein
MSAPRPSRSPAAVAQGRPWGLLGLMVIATLLAYANTFQVPFIFDDVPSIVENPTVRRLSLDALNPPREGGVTVSGRPVLNLSFALNHTISGLEVWSYHAVNLLIHVLAGLTLFGLVRRTLAHAALVKESAPPQPVIAAVIAGIWLLHPLQAESVTYLVQRAESLMGLFFLFTLYAFARAADSPRPRAWMTVSFAACLLCAGTKEVAALAPVLAFLYDRTFISGSFRAAWQRHRWRHFALALTWLPLAWLVASTGGNRGGTLGFGVNQSFGGYWLTQGEAITRYLWLSVWPAPLVFDYGVVPAPSWPGALAWGFPVLVLVAATLWALWRHPVAGFLGAWFLGILAPTSLMPGTMQMIVEHRMYLPLAAVIAFVAGTAATRMDPRRFLVTGLALALAAGAVTWHRNTLYRQEESLWQDTLAKRPDNARTHNNLGRYYHQQQRWDEAIKCFEQALRLDAGIWTTHFNLGLALMKAGRVEEAVAPLARAASMPPYFSSAHLNLGIALSRLGRAEEALPHFAAALRTDPWPVDVHFQWGLALAKLGRWREASRHYFQCLQLNPRHAEALSNWGTALWELKSIPEAVARFEMALRIRPDLPGVHFNLGLAHSALGNRAEAISHYREAIRHDPSQATALLNLGIALAQENQLPEAIGYLEEAARRQPRDPAIHANLGVALSLAGRKSEALAAYQTALQLQPNDAQAHYNVGFALIEAGRLSEARAYFETAVRLRPNFPAARDILNRLRELQAH